MEAYFNTALGNCTIEVAEGATIELLADDNVSFADTTDGLELGISKNVTITGAADGTTGGPLYTIHGVSSKTAA